MGGGAGRAQGRNCGANTVLFAVFAASVGTLIGRQPGQEPPGGERPPVRVKTKMLNKNSWCRWNRRQPLAADTAMTTIQAEAEAPPRWTWRRAPPGDSLLQSILRWLPGEPEPRREQRRQHLVQAARRAFLDGLQDLSGPTVSDLRRSLQRARSLRDLWHLRMAFYTEVGRALSQWEAERRLNALAPWFESQGNLALLRRLAGSARVAGDRQPAPAKHSELG